MTPEQATQLAQITFVIILFIPSLVIIGVLVTVAIKFLPVMVRQVQQLIDNNAQLTKIAQQNADQIKTTESVLVSITPELIKQTNAIENQTSVIRGQSLDLRNYQTLVSDNLSAHTQEIADLKASIDKLPEIVKQIVQDTIICSSVENIIKNFRDEVIEIIQKAQAKKATGTHAVVNGESTS